MCSHATIERKKIVLWEGGEECRTENIIYKCIVLKSGHPDKVYWRTAEGDF